MLSTREKLTIHQETLNNGSLLLFKKLPSAPRLAIVFAIPGGNQRDNIPGISDLVDRLLMKGTQSRSQEEIAIAIDGLTLDLDIDTKRDYSVISATLLEEDLEASLEIIADLFYNALPDKTLESELAREKEKLVGEIMMELDSPKSRASDLFGRTLFENTPYGVVSSVVLESLPLIDSAQTVKAHYQGAYQTECMVIAVTGNIDEKRLKKALESHFPKRQQPPSLIDPALITRLENLALPKNQYVSYAKDDSSQAHIYKGWLVPGVHHPDFYALSLMNTILGGAGLSSRLFLELRDKQGLAYNVRSALDTVKHKGAFTLYIGTEPSNKEKCLKGFEEECGKLIKTLVSAKELADAKRNMLGRRSIYLETGPQLCGYIAGNYVMGKTIEDIEALPERIEAITSADIQRVAEKYMSPSNPHVTSISGPSSIL
ncbi:MAG: pitrilysin family protein [Vampirovibrionales bacterium]|nr:pitrilysin family protein [Vampirovibrionales bacterium]